MYARFNYKPILTAVTLLAFAFVGVLPALAAAPANDDISTATAIISIPFSDGINTTEATSAPDDPYPDCNYYGSREATVWYQFSPATSQGVVASAEGSDYTTVLGVYTGIPGTLTQIGCGTDYNHVSFQANAGETYYIMVAHALFDPYPGGYGGNLQFSLTEASPPVAYFDAWFDPMAAPHAVSFNNMSYDPDCYWCSLDAFWEFGDGTTSWDWSPYHQYPADGSYLVNLTVTNQAGLTAQYQQQVDVVTPPPDASFYFNPYDPSVYDMVFFNYWSCWWCSVQWDFGDGATSTDMNPNHQYAADGDYTVSLTVTAPDGQSASSTQDVHVKTIDVAIARFVVPQTAKAGQTRSVNVEISNTTYPVEVEVQLYKSNGQYWEWVGSLQQTVPVRSANRTTRFEFSYTFTQADALLGTTNFRAVANLWNGRDAIPVNNEAISLPTSVKP